MDIPRVLAEDPQRIVSGTLSFSKEPSFNNTRDLNLLNESEFMQEELKHVLEEHKRHFREKELILVKDGEKTGSIQGEEDPISRI